MGITDGTMMCGLCGESKTSCELCGKAPLVRCKPGTRITDYDELKREQVARSYRAAGKIY